MPKIDFHEIPALETHPFAKKMADQYEAAAGQGSPSAWISDEQFAGALTMCAHTLAELLIRMMRRTDFFKTWTALIALGEMITNMVKCESARRQGGIPVARGYGLTGKQFYKEK